MVLTPTSYKCEYSIPPPMAAIKTKKNHPVLLFVDACVIIHDKINGTFSFFDLYLARLICL